MGSRAAILTFHHSYNCGSMLQAYALQETIRRLGHEVSVLNFSNRGQQRLYSTLERATTVKSVVKDLILLPHVPRIRRNYASYERFMRQRLPLDGPVVECIQDLSDDGYDVVVAGSDQVWNITIDDADDAYFLPWVTRARKVAYAASFGARNPAVHAARPQVYGQWLRAFDALSIRERNGRDWIRELTGLDVPVLVDPTLLLRAGDYEPIEDRSVDLPERYLFYYSPGYSRAINRFVAGIAERHRLPVIAFNTKTFHVKLMGLSGFRLPSLEDPAVYLRLMRNASVVVTTSFHGTVFPSIYRRPFWTVKNGGMYGDDDRVRTLLDILGLEDRLVPPELEPGRDYLEMPDFAASQARLAPERERGLDFLRASLDGEVASGGADRQAPGA